MPPGSTYPPVVASAPWNAGDLLRTSVALPPEPARWRPAVPGEGDEPVTPG